MARIVKDVMTKEVVVAGRDTPYKEIVELMHEHRVTALPVIDAQGRPIGIVSEADLLLKEELGPEATAARPQGTHRQGQRAKAAGRTAAELMTTPVVTVGPDELLPGAARLMHRHGVKRLPVVAEDGRVIGIVSRADLLRVFLRSDEDIREEIGSRVLGRLFSIEPGTVRLAVAEGVVRLMGQVERASMIPTIKEVVEGVDGVVGVELELTHRFDDTHVAIAAGPWGVYAPGYGPRR